MTNATGWNELYDGNLIGASFTMFNTATAGWVIAVLFLTYQIMLFLKTKNLPLVWTTSLIFLAIFGAIPGIIKQTAIQFIFIIMVIELAVILYYIFWK